MKIKIKPSFVVFLVFHIALTVSFTLVYYRLSQDEFTKHFNGIKRNDDAFINSLYFSFTTLSTVGYGDISPKSRIAKMLVMLHQILVLSNISSVLIAMQYYRSSVVLYFWVYCRIWGFLLCLILFRGVFPLIFFFYVCCNYFSWWLGITKYKFL